MRLASGVGVPGAKRPAQKVDKHALRKGISSGDTSSLVEILGALADPVRLGIVRCLADGEEWPGTTLAKRMGVSRALLCHHSAILVRAGIASRRKDGKVGFLRLNAGTVQGPLKRLLAETTGSRTRNRQAIF